MEHSKFTIHRRALMALSQLPPSEREEVLERVTSLAGISAGRWLPDQATRLPGDQPLFLVPVNGNLRVIIQAVEGHRPEVMDVVSHETLEFFTKSASA